jgi:anthranilate phosphoribosyltransferase
MTAGAALLTAGKARDLRKGVRLAEASIDNGAARKSLEKLVKASNG